jgi:hypothetical protein
MKGNISAIFIFTKILLLLRLISLSKQICRENLVSYAADNCLINYGKDASIR